MTAQPCSDCYGAGYVETSRGPVECDCTHEDPHDRDQYGVCRRCADCSDPSCCPPRGYCEAKR